MENRFIDAEDNPTEFLVDAQIPIINEMFTIAGEEGINEMWCDEQHPLTQAVRILHKAKVQVKYGCVESEGDQVAFRRVDFDTQKGPKWR
ncbi:MAG TPA: hypothetical protein VMQ17_23890 [Candidatus Sulfotelmatobacter sp.]|nr:hypothetical protein [Candidatus Sulfotelmatobacter sp.]